MFIGNKRNTAQPPEYQTAPPAMVTPPAASATSPHAAISSRPEVPISNELMAKHEESRRKYPRVHLSKGEYVVLEVRRHPIGLISAWLSSGLLAVLAIATIPLYSYNRSNLASIFDINISHLPTVNEVALPLFALAALFVLGGFLAVYVYNGNLFYLTNESIMQYIQSSIVSTKEQQINLVNVDDVSYRQQGIMQQVFNYGTIRVTTEGDEQNPYIFQFVASPQRVSRMVNDAMEEATGFAVRYRHHGGREEEINGQY